jgi:peptide/nickel transport system substrate-binding protein
VAKGYDMSSDGKVLTLTLRRGMRWSDGAPFTADDILFWYEDIYGNREILPSKTGALQINGKDVTIEKVDPLTVRFVSPDPNYLLVPLLASATEIGGPASSIGSLINGYGGYAPKHYLMKFLPRYAPQAELDRRATAASFTGWVSYFKNRADWNLNADLPVLSPWKVARGRELSRSTWQWERNPYSIWVDTEGNQLPYIDTITYTLAESLEVVALRATTGEYDVQDRGLDLAKLPVLLQNQDSGRYKIWLDPSPIVDFGIRLNLAYDEDPLIGDLLRKADFRRALSLGVDRDAINETFFLGTGTPSANIPSDESPYFPGKEWRTKWATLDVAQANRLLDAVGLQQKDAEGYRTRTDGKGRLRLDYTVSTGSFADFAVIGEMIREQWKKIGIDLAINSIQSTLLVQRARAGQLQLSGHIVGTEDIFITPSPVIPFDTTNYPGMIGIPYAQWLQSGGRSGREPFAELKQAFDLWKKGYASPESGRNEAGRDIYKLAADQVFSIGVVGMGLVSYGIHLVKTNVGNVPERYISSNMTKAPAIALPQTFYFK